MSVDMSIVRSATGGGKSKSVSTVVSGDNSIVVETVVAIGATDVLLIIALDYDLIKGLYILSDQDLTIKTNNSGAPDDTIELKANEVLEWHKFAIPGQEYYSNLLTVDVTEMHLVTGALSGAVANLTMIIVQYATV